MTNLRARATIFALESEMKSFHCITFTHQNVGVNTLGKFHVAPDNQNQRLSPLKSLGIEEFMFLSTCNRVEFWFRSEEELTQDFLSDIVAQVYPLWSDSEKKEAAEKAVVFSHLEAVDHVFRVASSLESLVIGEREILTQVREAYTQCAEWGFSGDFLRILIRKTIEIAKEVYTNTDISTRPISVVNLAYRLLRQQNYDTNSRILFVGSGKTNQAMARKLSKAGYKNFSIYNRTVANAESMAKEFGGSFESLDNLNQHSTGFDVLISCTGSEHEMVNLDLFRKLRSEDSGQKTVVDLAIPFDIDSRIKDEAGVEYISIEQLKEIAAKNLEARKGDLEKCEAIVREGLNDFQHLHKVRKVELAMRKVPQQVKDIRHRATEVVFAEEINELDDKSRETLEKVLSFVEKKYMSTPMLLAKEILLQKEIK